MNIVLFLLIGLVAGFLTGKLWKGRGFGFLGNLVVGVVGAVVGGLLFGILGIAAQNVIGELVTAIVGAFVFLAVVAALRKG